MKKLLLLLTILTASCWAQCPQGYASVGGACVGAPSVQIAQITLTAAQINTMFTTPVLVIPAQGTGTIIVITRSWYYLTGPTPFTGGGIFTLSFGSPVISAAISATIPVATFTGLSVNAFLTSASTTAFQGTSNALNQGVYASNATGVFAGGAGSTLTINVQYLVFSNLQ